jgi:hypothetical protein
MILFEYLSNLYGKNLVVWGGSAKLLLTHGSISGSRDLDLMIAINYQKLQKQLIEFGINVEFYPCCFCPAFMKSIFKYDDIYYDIVCLSPLGCHDIDDMVEFCTSLPHLPDTLYYQDGKFNMSAEEYSDSVGKFNPKFNYKWYTKQDIVDYCFRKNRPSPPQPNTGDQYLDNGRPELERELLIIGRFVDKQNPYHITQWDINSKGTQ